MAWQFLLLGILIGVCGWLLYRAGLPAIGALIGGSFGGALGYLASVFVTPVWIPVLTGVGIVLGGVAGILLFKALQIYFFFVTGISLGAAFGYKMLEGHIFGLSSATVPGWIFAAACSIVGGLVLVWARRFIVAFVTSIAGALITSIGFPPEWRNVAMIVALVLFLSIQIGLVHRFVDQEEFDRRTRRRLRDTEYPDVDTAD